MAYQYLRFFLEDDKELAELGALYESGHLLTGQLKQRAVQVITSVVLEHQRARAAVTDEAIRHFMSVRPLVG